jgi:hypothetical protein
LIELFFCPTLNFSTHATKLLDERGAVSRDILQHNPEHQTGHRVQVTSEGLAAHAQRF